MQWKDDFKMGISVIDAQHKQLFLCHNQLNEALSTGLKPSMIDTFLTQLGFYVARHFSVEEQYMAASAYPGLARQVEAHRYFTNRFAEIQEIFKQKGLSPVVVHAIQDEMSHWIENHVLGLDQEFGMYYRENKTNE